MEVFFSYSRRDERFRRQLDNHLSLLQRNRVIHTWSAHDVPAGTDFDDAARTRLNSAQVILLLVSPDFLASNYCYDVEMTRAVRRLRAVGPACTF